MLTSKISRRGFMQLMAAAAGTATLNGSPVVRMIEEAIPAIVESEITLYKPLTYIQMIRPFGPILPVSSFYFEHEMSYYTPIYGMTDDGRYIDVGGVRSLPSNYFYEIESDFGRRFDENDTQEDNFPYFEKHFFSGNDFDFKIVVNDKLSLVVCEARAIQMNIEATNKHSATRQFSVASSLEPEWIET